MMVIKKKIQVKMRLLSLVQNDKTAVKFIVNGLQV